jgi:predicted MPP superfamily phosphohydrolase
MLRNLIITISLGILVGKLVISAVMLANEARRLVEWIIDTVKPPKTEVRVDTKGIRGISRSRFFQQVAIGLGGAAVLTIITGMANRYRYRMHQVKLVHPKIPEAFKGLKIVQISDIHSGSFDDIAAVTIGVNKIMELKPDIIVFTGDLVNNTAEEIEPYLELFGRLNASLGVYSTLGNHDYGEYEGWASPEAKAENLKKLKQAHARMGWKLLLNEHVILTRGEDQVAVIGVENWSVKEYYPKHGDLEKAYEGLADKDATFKVLLSHDPSHWDAVVRAQYPDIDLTLSGHTHGMQCGIEIPGFKWSPVQYIYQQWAGLYQEGSQYLYVNRGYGCFSGYPGRLGILPEITLIELA